MVGRHFFVSSNYEWFDFHLQSLAVATGRQKLEQLLRESSVIPESRSAARDRRFSVEIEPGCLHL